MVLERGKNDMVSYYAVSNNNCPSDALRMILEKGNDDFVSRFAAVNQNCPSDALRMVLERGNNDRVSWIAAKNLSCPPDSSIRWKIKVGLIQTEAPEHKIQYVNKPRDDSDLKKLQELIIE